MFIINYFSSKEYIKDLIFPNRIRKTSDINCILNIINYNLET